MRVVAWVCVLATLLTGTRAQAQDAIVDVMVLGTYHMGNPGLDLVNAQVDDVTRPQRQREIQAVVDALARWRPTKVLIEWQMPAPFTVPQYRTFMPAQLATDRNEIVQIGFRLARQLGHADVYGFDEQSGEGEPEYFQFDRVQAFAEAHGRSALIEDTLAYFRRGAAEMEALQRDHSVAQLLLRNNDPDRERAEHARGYYFVLPLGDTDNQAGAEFNAYWYMRNAKMFGKIALIAEPGDRVLVLVGSGHRYWLTHFAGLVPGFRAVDPRPYLEEAAAAR